MSAPSMTPDLQRIVEALKACRERYWLTTSSFGCDVMDGSKSVPAFVGSVKDAREWIDARCAEAMVRAIREPSQATIEAGWLNNICTSDQVWRAMCDAILGEKQP